MPTRKRTTTATPVSPDAPEIEPAAPPAVEDDSWVEADAIEVSQGAIGRADATRIDVSQGAVGAARADTVAVEMSALGAAMAGEVTISRSAAVGLMAQRVQVEQSFVRTLVAQAVEVRRPSLALVVIAQRVSGDVRVLLDWRAAAAFGVAVGLVSAVAGRARRARGTGA